MNKVYIYDISKAITSQKSACMDKNNIDIIHDDDFNSIQTLMDKSKNLVAREINNSLLQTY